eukprot:1334120-Amorphochlora_amoeboformis.AAC.1
MLQAVDSNQREMVRFRDWIRARWDQHILALGSLLPDVIGSRLGLGLNLEGMEQEGMRLMP